MVFDSPPALGGGAVLEGQAAPAWAPVPKPAPEMVGSASRRWSVIGVAGVVGVGIAERVWVAVHPLGTLTSDGSVIGLMAMGLLHHGRLSAYMWGQSYGGSLEAVLTAVVFAVTGSGTGQLLAACALANASAVLALWHAGRRIVGGRAALFGALAFWVWPEAFVWRSLKPGGTYMVGLALSLCALAALARLHNGDGRWRHMTWTGALCGLAFWSSPMSLQILVPAALWCGPALWRARRHAPALLCGAAVGAFPVIVFGATHRWSNVAVPGGTGLIAGVPHRLVQFFTTGVPIALGVRVEGSLTWVGGPFGVSFAWAAFVAVVALGVVVTTGRAARCRLPLLTVVLLPLLYSLNQDADVVGQGRYVMFGAAVGALLVGVGMDNVADLLGQRVLVGGIVALVVLCTAGLAMEPAPLLVRFGAPDVAMPTNTAPLQAALVAHDVRDAFATYWVAYRTTFESGGRVAVTAYARQYPPFAGAVLSSNDPAYIFVTTSATLGRFESWCAHAGVPVHAWRAGSFTIVQPVTKVLPASLPAGLVQ
ncbi:MAG: glycosyltransferase family 39 protein [Acidimicrobiales bacterium]|nr:glycosyltransferase family 39 protein [Acidimicrobiales bacterium]